VESGNVGYLKIWGAKSGTTQVGGWVLWLAIAWIRKYGRVVFSIQRKEIGVP